MLLLLKLAGLVLIWLPQDNTPAKHSFLLDTNVILLIKVAKTTKVRTSVVWRTGCCVSSRGRNICRFVYTQLIVTYSIASGTWVDRKQLIRLFVPVVKSWLVFVLNRFLIVYSHWVTQPPAILGITESQLLYQSVDVLPVQQQSAIKVTFAKIKSVTKYVPIWSSNGYWIQHKFGIIPSSSFICSH